MAGRTGHQPTDALERQAGHLLLEAARLRVRARSSPPFESARLLRDAEETSRLVSALLESAAEDELALA